MSLKPFVEFINGRVTFSPQAVESPVTRMAPIAMFLRPPFICNIPLHEWMKQQNRCRLPGYSQAKINGEQVGHFSESSGSASVSSTAENGRSRIMAGTRAAPHSASP